MNRTRRYVFDLLASGKNVRTRNRRKVGNNTYAVRNGDGVDIILHDTVILSYNADGTETLNAGGWRTVTTKARLNEFSKARVFSERGEWRVYDGTLTPLREGKCRSCHGLNVASFEDERMRVILGLKGLHASEDCPAKKLDNPYAAFASYSCRNCVRSCWKCSDTGRATYGGKWKGTPFYNGITVDSETGIPVA